MVCLPVVRPFLKNDVRKLASHFQKNDYLKGNGVFYVALEDNEGKTSDVSAKIFSTWSQYWVTMNNKFEAMLAADPALQVFCGKMFHVWDGNHRIQAWMPIISNDHLDDISWHYTVESNILVVNGDVVSMFTALHEVNWYVLIAITYSLHFISFLSRYIIYNFILIFCHPGEIKIHMWLETLCIGSTVLIVLPNNQWSSSSLWCLKMIFELRR